MLALALAPATGWGHGGGLDDRGCHRETATGGHHCHRAGHRDDGKTDHGAALAVLGGLCALALIIHSVGGGDEAAHFGAAPAATWRASSEALAGRPGIAAGRAVGPRLWIGIWAATPMPGDPNDGATDVAPTMVFGRLRF